MALTVNTSKAAPNSIARQRPFDCGVTMMAIGLREVTKKNYPDAVVRIQILSGLYGDCGVTADDLLGVEINGTNETAAQWLKRTYGARRARIEAMRAFDEAKAQEVAS